MSPFLFGICVGIITGYLIYKIDPSIHNLDDKVVLFYTNLKSHTRDYVIIFKK